MWLTTQWKLRRALCRYRRDGDVDAVLGADWSRSREIFRECQQPFAMDYTW